MTLTHWECVFLVLKTTFRAWRIMDKIYQLYKWPCWIHDKYLCSFWFVKLLSSLYPWEERKNAHLWNIEQINSQDKQQELFMQISTIKRNRHTSNGINVLFAPFRIERSVCLDKQLKLWFSFSFYLVVMDLCLVLRILVLFWEELWGGY